MISGFQTGKNQKIQLVENEKYNKIIIQFEDLSEDEEVFKSDNKPTKNDLNLLNSLSKEAIKTNNQLYHPSKFAEQEFKFMSKNPRDSLSEKKFSFQTVIMADEIQKEIITPIKKKESNNNNEIFQMNTILLSKISKLPKCLIGEKFYEISKQFMKNSLLKFNSFCRLSTIPQNFDWKLIKEYFTLKSHLFNQIQKYQVQTI